MAGIELQNVSKIYNEGDNQVVALQDVSIRVQPGEFIAVIGPSGSGKSTLLSILGALLQPTSGKVTINEKDIGTLKPNQLAEFRLNEVGFILQRSNLVPYLSVLDQLLVIQRMKGKLTSTGKEFAKSLLSELGIAEKRKKFPNQLSGGERQRTAIARAFVNNPNVILADEPTASLDTNRAYEVVELIAKEVKTRNKAAIMVTHDERMLKYCDKVYRMEDGRLFEN